MIPGDRFMIYILDYRQVPCVVIGVHVSRHAFCTFINLYIVVECGSLKEDKRALLSGFVVLQT